MERYSRQMLFTPIGKEGQNKLLQSSVLVIGAGALGTVILNHLVRSGIGYIRLVDRDYVEFSNLQRQMLYDEEDARLAKPKAIAAKEKLEKVNKDVKIDAHIEHVSVKNIDELTQGIDIIFDGTDNFQTRYLLNDISYKKNIPFSYGGVISSRGMTAFFIPNQTPCLRCLMNNPSPEGQTCDTVGVISPIVHIISSLQVSEGLKYITGNINSLHNNLLSIDIWNNNFMKIHFNEQDPSCPTCKLKQFPSLQHKRKDDEVVLCGRNTVQIDSQKQIDLYKWKERLEKVAETNITPFLLQVRFPNNIKMVLFKDGRVLIQGTEDIIKARTLYDRYIGS